MDTDTEPPEPSHAPQAGFVVNTEAFQGPLDLLLSLIEKRKLFINDISLSSVADDYIAHVRNLGQFPIADSAHFVLIASTLVLIKSKSLLPTLALTEEEQGSIEELEHRLKLYQRTKELSFYIKERFGREIIFAKSPVKNFEPVFSPPVEATPLALCQAIKDMLKSLPKKEVLPKTVVKKVISLEEMIESLTARITSNLKMSFREFAGQKGGRVIKADKEEKVNIIIGFLAMLELVKQGVIMVTQEKEFEDIQIETQDIGVPRYT